MTLSEIKRANAAAGHYFFEPDTLRFFRSRCSEQTYGRHFATSEKGPNGIRAWSVRRCEGDGSIETVGEFQGYPSLARALTAA
ncbi:MAG TPA: hypothetical protein VM285_17605, partial [Polyangia bacterium]|nr:hypothetical protein [Polyangia bacterium]